MCRLGSRCPKRVATADPKVALVDISVSGEAGYYDWQVGVRVDHNIDIDDRLLQVNF